jgi:hypothetical protein
MVCRLSRIGWLLVMTTSFFTRMQPHHTALGFGHTVFLGALHLIKCSIKCFAVMVSSCNGVPQFCGFLQQELNAQHLYD